MMLINQPLKHRRNLLLCIAGLLVALSACTTRVSYLVPILNAPDPAYGLSAESIEGRIYYVATDGDDTQDGSFEAPFRTLNKAGSVVQPGDVIRLREGVYYEYNDLNDGLGLPATSFTTSGTPDKPIVIESQPGEWAVLDGSKLPDGSPFRAEDGTDSNPQRPFLLYLSVNHYIIRNLEVRNSVGGGITVNPGLNEDAGNNNLFSHLHLHHNHGNGLSAHGLSYISSNGDRVDREVTGNIVEYVVSHHNQSIRNGGDSADGIKMSNSNGGLVRNVLLYKNSDDGVDFIGSKNMSIQNSVAWLNGYFWTDDDNDPYDASNKRDAPNGNGQGFKMGGDSSGRRSNNKAIHNIAFWNKSFGFHFNGAGGVKFYNNSSYNNDAGGFAARCYSSLELNNNLSIDEENTISATKDNKCEDGKTPKQNKNSWNLKTQNPRVQSLDPYNDAFLSLQDNSPLINTGRHVGLPYTGNAPDVGALELGEVMPRVEDMLLAIRSR